MSKTDEEFLLRAHRRRFIKKFSFGVTLFVGGLCVWFFIFARVPTGREMSPFLRRMHEWNEKVSGVLFRKQALARTFPESSAREPRVNGKIGMKDDPNFDPAKWSLSIEGNGKRVTLVMKDILALPKVTMTTEFKCIEGWSEVVTWAGPTLASLFEKYDLLSNDDRKRGYVGLSTPNGKYYVGIEMDAALHPQTLLAYEMNGKPLTLDHGAPLRLATPLKYGIKNIKRIGHIVVGPDRPSDYWAERGYDWYSGH